MKLSKRYRRLRDFLRIDQHTRLIRNVCIFLSALVAFNLLNRNGAGSSRKRALSPGLSSPDQSEVSPYQPKRATQEPPLLAGKTIDFTLFTTSHAISVLVLALWARTKYSRHQPNHPSTLSRLADPAVFSVSTALIMRAWLYFPQSLPRTYNHWIHKAANVDPRILSALRLARTRDWAYGSDNGDLNQVLRGASKELGLPEEWGDPAISVPVRCEVIHSGCGPSCEIHALWRFWCGWKLGMKTYLPLQLILRTARNPSLDSLTASIAPAARSSLFLGAFISLFHYTVCLCRTRLGPLLLPPPTTTTNP